MTIFVCSAPDIGAQEECICCGGWLYAGGYFGDDGEWVYVRDPHAPYQGSNASLRYCSPECMDEWEGVLRAMDKKRNARRAWEDFSSEIFAAVWDGKS